MMLDRQKTIADKMLFVASLVALVEWEATEVSKTGRSAAVSIFLGIKETIQRVFACISILLFLGHWSLVHSVMGIEVQCESYYPGYLLMRDINGDSNSCIWPLYHFNKTFTNGQYHNGFLPSDTGHGYLGYDKDVVKHTMLEHEAIFKNQVLELHRLYRIQRDLMDEFRTERTNQNQVIGETSSSSHLASEVSSEDARKRHKSNFLWSNPVSSGPYTSGLKETPIFSTKESSSRASPMQSRNGCNSKDLEILELKPANVRREIDLQLPADSYIDNKEEEQHGDRSSSHGHNKNHETAPRSGVNTFLGHGKMNHLHGDLLFSQSSLRNTVDLNEPIDVDETNAPACVDIRGHDLCAKEKSRFMDFLGKVPLSSHHKNNTATLTNPNFMNSGHGKSWFPHVLETRHNENGTRSVYQRLQTEKQTSSCQMHFLHNKSVDSSTLSVPDPRDARQLRERTDCGLQLPNREDNNSRLEYVSKTQLPKSGSHYVASWEKPGRGLGQRATEHQQNLHFYSSTMSRSSQSSMQSHGVFGDRWKYIDNSASSRSFGDQLPRRNGFYYGSSSRSKELVALAHSGNHDNVSYNIVNNTAPERMFGYSSGKSINSGEFSGAKDCRLNGFLSNSSFNKEAPEKATKVIDLERSNKDHQETLPWLKPKPVRNAVMDLNSVDSSFLQSPLSQLSHKEKTKSNKTDSQNLKLVTCSDVDVSGMDINDSMRCSKILGFPIFEKPHDPKNDLSSFTAASVTLQPSSVSELDKNRKNRVIDINLPYEPAVPNSYQQSAEEEVVTIKESTKKPSNFRNEIDLNTCMNKDEESMTLCALGLNGKTTGIDLEAPAMPEDVQNIVPGELCREKTDETALQSLNDKADGHQNEIVRMAAEAIVALAAPHNDDSAICFQSEDSVLDSLNWFADIVFSCREDLINNVDAVSGSKGEEGGSFSEDMDYFESMTLKLIETKKEDYMPRPLVLENLNLEEAAATVLPTRTRRGPARRGRQRKNFRRGILPGLASLSRHEVTEDLQTFGGLMKAMGHSWNSGLTRKSLTRNGGGRGRKRSLTSSLPTPTTITPCTPLIQKLCNVEMGLEDRSLTGWGRTTRRPRRQRCSAGIPPTIRLT